LLKKDYFFCIICVCSLFLITFFSSCSHELTSYDEITTAGNIEDTARKKYSKFFKAIEKLEVAYGESEVALQDSSLIVKVAQLTDKVIEDIQPFPTTVESRIALDALSYAGNDIANSPHFSSNELSNFWEYALVKPLFSLGHEFIKSDDINESAHLQIIKAFQRSMSSKTTDEMLVDCITMVGVVPSQKVMEFCDSDTLVFKKIHDLILYTRSLQTVDPPVWMLSGPWFLAIEFANWPTIFISLVPVMVNGVPYLTFKNFNRGKVYSALFDDPVPDEKSKWDSWLTRGNAVMNSLTYDTALIKRVRNCELPTYDAHNFFNEYLLHTELDTTRKEFLISFVRNKVQESAFSFTGMDSIAVVLDSLQIASFPGDIVRFSSIRTLGATMQDDNFFRGRTLQGSAYLLPLGKHDKRTIEAYQKSRLPKMEVKAVSPDK